MKLQDIIDAERQLNRTLSGLSQIGIDKDTKRDLNNAIALIQEVRHYAITIGDLRPHLTGGTHDEALASERLTQFIRHGIFAKG